MSEVIHDLVCTTSSNNINIRDSYTVMNKKEMAEVLYVIQHRHPECEVFKIRKWDNLLSEWKCHSRLYNWGLFKSNTKDADLDINEPWWRKILYTIFGV